jgi:PAS domain S-box-containing protein
LKRYIIAVRKRRPRWPDSTKTLSGITGAVHPSSAAIDYRLRHKNGLWRWVHSHRLALIDEAGAFLGYLCLDRDTTDQIVFEEAVRAERDRAQEYLNIASVILVAIDAQQKVTLINKKGREILGWDEVDIVGSNWFDRFVPPRDREATRAVFKQLMAGNIEPAEYFENAVQTHDGRERLIAWHNTMLRNKQGDIIGTLSSGEDITERRRAEKALRQTEEQFRALFEGTTSCIFFIQDRVIKYANEAALRVFNYQREEMLGQSTALVHLSPEKYEEFGHIVYPVLQKSASWQGEWPFRKKDGGIIWMDNYVSRLPDGGMVAILHDITDQVEAKSALSEREAELSSIFRAAPVGIGLVSDRLLLQVNERMCDMLGYTRDELIGQSARILYPTDEDFEYVGREKYSQIREQGSGTVETRWQCKDGRIIDVLLSSAPLDPDDWSKGVTFTSLDITERKKQEQALVDKNIALREVLSQISAEKESIREQIATNIDEAVMPTLRRLKEGVDPDQIAVVKLLARELEEISSPFLELLKSRHPRLTPRETEICRMIKNGLSSKEIAETLGISLTTVHKHRELIRRKLGLSNVDVNLASYLQTL